MSVIQSLQSLAANVRVTARETAQSGLQPFANVEIEGRTDLLRARSRLIRLYRALEALADAANVEVRSLFDISDARSSSSLGLDLTRTAASLESSDEVNASPMSFTPFGPDWTDSSSALLTIGGAYDGSNGTGSLSFEVRRAGTHGVDDLRIRVEDLQGGPVRNINISASDPIDQQYDLLNGLYFTLGPGSLINRDFTTIQVFDSVGAVVNPDNPLGGVRNQNPNLEFGMPAIVDGAFQLNGANINVSTSDTINDVLARINGSAAGVTATFNATSERIEFLHNTVGSSGAIDLQSDTSNFLQATKLDSANTVPGIDADNERAISDVAAFSTVQSGQIVINGQQISLDTTTDSLDTMIDRINAAGAGVTASFDQATQLVTIRADEGTGALEIDSNGTAFFAALNIADGQYETLERGRGLGRRQSYAIADTLDGVFSELNYLFRDSSFVQRGDNAAAFRGPLESAIRTAFGDNLENGIGGLSIDSGENARRRGGYASLDRTVLTRELQIRADILVSLLRGAGDDKGLVERLLIGTQQAVHAVNSQLGVAGGIVDVFA